MGARRFDDDTRFTDGIWPAEMKEAKDRTQIGDRLTVINTNRLKPHGDGFGVSVRVTVDAKYPYIAHLDNGMSVTYEQLAVYYRSMDREGKACVV